MVRHRARLIAVVMVAASALIAAAGAQATQAKNKPEADLALQRITIERHHVVVEPNGKASPISVTLSIRNIGHAAAPASVTLVKLVQGTRPVASEEIPLPRLAPGHAGTQIEIFRDAEPELGFLRASAKADRDNEVTGGLGNDFRATPDIPVIAQRWLARGMEVDEKVPGLGFGGDEDDDTATSTVSFQFSHVASHPARFVYRASGEVTETTTVSGQCSAEGEMSASMSPWGQDSGLFISTSLKQYEATVRASLAKPFTIGESCQGEPVTVPRTVRFHDLLTTVATHGAPLPMSPSERKLSGHVANGALSSLVYSWTILADVP